MARMKRLVLPGIPHRVAQRENNRQDVFFVRADGLVSRCASPGTSVRRRVSEWREAERGEAHRGMFDVLCAENAARWKILDKARNERTRRASR